MLRHVGLGHRDSCLCLGEHARHPCLIIKEADFSVQQEAGAEVVNIYWIEAAWYSPDFRGWFQGPSVIVHFLFGHVKGQGAGF